MDGTRPTLPQRVTAVLRARQYLVFFAIGLYAFDILVPLASAWLYRRGSVADALGASRGALADAVAGHSLLIGALFGVYLLATTWLRAGYIRSLVGRLHLGPQDARQFLRLLGLEALLELLGLGAAGAVTLAGEGSPLVAVVVFALLFVYFAVLYADYIVILGEAGPLRAVLLSARTARAAYVPSALILVGVTLAGLLGDGLLGESVTGSLAQAAPMLLVQCVVLGAVLFAADVALVVIYTEGVQSGRGRATRL